MCYNSKNKGNGVIILDLLAVFGGGLGGLFDALDAVGRLP